MISIHAPVKGATTGLQAIIKTSYHFNPRSREGSDICAAGGKCECRNFNPRSREGSDPLFLWSATNQQISIHAPVKGATYAFPLITSCASFQSTLP